MPTILIAESVVTANRGNETAHRLQNIHSVPPVWSGRAKNKPGSRFNGAAPRWAYSYRRPY